MTISDEKIKQLGAQMNAKSQFTIPLVQPVKNCFRIVMNEEEADFLLAVGARQMTREQLCELYGKPQQFDAFFADILRKSLMWKRNGAYELAPIFPGWIEVYGGGSLDDPARRRMMEEFAAFEDWLLRLNIPPVRLYMNHVNSRTIQQLPARMSVTVSRGKKSIALDEPITAEQAVTTAGEIMPMLERHADQLAVMNCFCRTLRRVKGESCAFDLSLEGCMMVGALSEQIADSGIGRKISLEEARRMIADFEQKGCIHTIYHYGMDTNQEEIAICNCCVDCCFLYHGYRSGSLSQILVKAYVMPEIVDENACVGCGKCGNFCPTEATWYDKKQKKLNFLPENCIGCGQCAVQCPFPVRVLRRNERRVFVRTKRRTHA